MIPYSTGDAPIAVMLHICLSETFEKGVPRICWTPGNRPHDVGAEERLHTSDGFAG
jgi:hypothetical protein